MEPTTSCTAAQSELLQSTAPATTAPSPRVRVAYVQQQIVVRVHRQERDTLRTIPREVQTVLAVHIAPVDGVAVRILAPGIVAAPARAQLVVPQPVDELK